MDNEEKFARTNPRFFEHCWKPPEEDDEDIPATERKFREIDWVWEGILPRGGTSIVSAAPKVGKTTFIANLAVAHARGDGVFLGRKLDQGIVTLVILEGSSDEILKTVHMLNKGDSLPIWVRTFRPKSFQDAKSQLTKIIKKDMPSLLCIDTLWKLVRTPDVSDYAGMAEGVELIDHLSREFGTHILATHHDKKSSKGDISGVLGSTSIVGGVDTILQITKAGRIRKMQSTQRHGTDLEPIGLSLMNNRELTMVDIYEDENRMVLDSLLKKPNATIEHLIQTVKMRRESIIRVLLGLIKSGKVTRCGKGTPHYPYYHNIQKD